MKKYTFLWLSFILLICLCSCGDPGADTAGSFPAAAGLSASDFSDTTRQRDENYAAVLKTKTVTLDTLTVHIAERIFDEETSPALAEKIAVDCAALRELDSAAAKPAEVYVLPLTATGAAAAAGNELFCTLEQVESGDYRPYLARTVFGHPVWWQCVGLSRMVFGAEIAEGFTAELAAKLEQDVYLLSLFPSYFLEEFAGEETRELAAQTAQALTEHILSECDLPAFLAEGDKAACRMDWLERIGVSAELGYLQSDAAAYVARLPFSESKDVPLSLKDVRFTLNLRSTDWLTTAGDAYYFTLDFYQSLGALTSFLEANAPVYYASLQAGEIKRFSINIFDSGYSSFGSSANADRGEAAVLAWKDALHEAVHCFIPESSVTHEDDWLSEGLATWLSAPYISVDAGRSQIDQFAGSLELSQLPEDVRELAEMIASVFRQITGRDISGIYDMEVPEDRPVYWLYQSMIRAVLLLPDSGVSLPFATLPVADRRGFPNSYPGNRLSYGEAMLFVDYLAEEYGLDTVIAALMDGAVYHELFPDKEAFGEVYGQFLEQQSETPHDAA